MYKKINFIAPKTSIAFGILGTKSDVIMHKNNEEKPHCWIPAKFRNPDQIPRDWTGTHLIIDALKAAPLEQSGMIKQENNHQN